MSTMVSGKVKGTMGFQRTTANPKPDPPQKPPSPSPSSGASKVQQKGSAPFSRSFGVYFPRASAQVQPRPPDVTELLHLLDEMRDRESRLKTELREQKELLAESIAVVPILKNEISKKDNQIGRSEMMVACLEAENEGLRQEVEMLHTKLSEQRRESDEKVKAVEAKLMEPTKAQIDKDCEELSTSQKFQGLIDASLKSNLMKKNGTFLENYNYHNKNETELQRVKEKAVNCEFQQRVSASSSSDEITEFAIVARSRVPRIPKPPPKPSVSFSSVSVIPSSPTTYLGGLTEPSLNTPSVPHPPRFPMKAAPPPPPPLPKVFQARMSKVRRVPEVVEFYHSLMRRDSRRESGGTGAADLPATANVRDMIGEIENRSTHLLAIKTDVETQGDFIRYLIKEVDNAAFSDIEDVVPFVKWLDDELSFLVDERAVLKHFQWPEEKADTLREAAFGYCDLKKLESEASSFRDDPRQPCASALKKMQSLFEKLEHGVYNLSRTRDTAAQRYKGFQIPIDWMLDSGYVNQIKLASVKLAMKYMKRVSAELEAVGDGPDEEELIVQGVKFAFRVHQFAGGFDMETMKAFKELRDKARSCHIQCHQQQ